MAFLLTVSILWALSFGLIPQVSGLGAAFVAAAFVAVPAFLALDEVAGAAFLAGAALAVPADFFTAVNSTSFKDLPVTPRSALWHCGQPGRRHRRAGDPTVPGG